MRIVRFHLLGVLLLGCGGRVLVEGDGGTLATSDASGSPTARTSGMQQGGDDGSTGAGDPGQPFPICPPALPAIGASCAVPGQGCAFYVLTGSLTDCQAVLCDASGHWQSAPQGC
jgi:hypothetical protein